jgi:hypothetical protein
MICAYLRRSDRDPRVHRLQTCRRENFQEPGNNREYRSILLCVMDKSLLIPPVLWLALTLPAAAQTAATTSSVPVAGGGLANPYGAVNLPTTTNTAVTAAQTNSAAAALTATTPGGSTTGSSSTGAASSTGSGSGSASSVATTGGSTTSGSTGSGNSSATGTTARSSTAPGWVLCPPTGASGLAPFVTGTDLSCAP